MTLEPDLPPQLKPGQMVVKATGTDKPPLMLVTKRALSPHNVEQLRRSLQEYLDTHHQRVVIIEGCEIDLYQLVDGKWVPLKEESEI